MPESWEDAHGWAVAASNVTEKVSRNPKKKRVLDTIPRYTTIMERGGRKNGAEKKSACT